MENLSLFDLLPEDLAKAYKPIKSTDWKWTMANDYPKEKNGLKVFSCFACGGGSTMGYKLAGCDVIGCNEIDPRMNKVYVENHHPKYNYLQDIREFNKRDDLPSDLYDLDILDGSPPCFEKGTLVKTINGYKPIEKIEVGDFVLTHNGNYKEVYDTMNKVCNEYYELKIQGCIPFMVTKNHPFYVKTMKRKGHNWDRTFDSEGKWVNVENLHIDKNKSGTIIEQDYIAFPIIQKEEIPYWEGITYKQNVCGKKTISITKNNLDLSDCNFWYFVGRYIGDGWLRDSRKETIICCAKSELNDLIEICKNARFNYCLTEQKTIYRLTISNVELYAYLKQFGKGAKGKHLTSDIFNLPIKQLKSFLDGYISADGYVENNNLYRIDTVSKQLAFGIQQCIAKAYHQPTTITTRTPIDKIEGRSVKVSMCYSLSFRKEKCKQQHFIYENGYLWLPFRSKKLIQNSLQVYNFSVKDDESYTVYNLACHNCTTFSMAGDREDSWGVKKKFREGQVEQTLDDLSFVFIETVAKLRPKVMIMENVEGLIKGEAWSYVQKIYKQLNSIGYKVKHWLLKGENMGVPQTRHRVFFVATSLDFDLDKIDMIFNYEPITYKEIKEGNLKLIGRDTKFYKIAENARPQDKSIADTRIRMGDKGSAFQTYYIRENDIMPTIRSKPDVIDLSGIGYISWQTIRNSQSFPQDYEFLPNTEGNVGYICGMSVPPIMIKRIVNRLIESGLFDYKVGVK